MSKLEVRLETFDPTIHPKRLRDWLHRPHVARWWGDPRLALKSVLQRSMETHAMIVVDEVTVGYLSWQMLPRNELESAGLSDLPLGLVDIDVLIGEPENTGHGVGPRALALLLDRLRADPMVSLAGVGTSVSNDRAIRAFEKAGFRQFREFDDPELGSCVYMVADVRDAA